MKAQPEPRLKVELVLTNPLLVEHFAPILHALQRRGCDAAFVCLPPARTALRRASKIELYERCLQAVTRARQPLHLRADPRAHVAITALGSNELHLYERIKLKLRYGVSLHRAAIHHNRAMASGFDGLLAHGPFERDLFSRWFPRDRIVLMGMPRHAAYLAQPLGQEQARAQLDVRARPGQAVLAYLPTWSSLSSLHPFGAALALLAREHHLLVKPHALSLTAPAERAALAMLERAGAQLMQQEATFAAMLASADLVLTDSTSGATTEALLLAADTPSLLLSVRTHEDLFCEIDRAGPSLRDPARLQGEVARLLAGDVDRAQRLQLRKRLFADCGGRDAERAAEGIAALARKPKLSSAPGLLERSCPRAFRVIRGQATALGAKYAPIPPRNVAPR